MLNEDLLNSALYFLFESTEYADFFIKYVSKNEINSKEDLLICLSGFKTHLSEIGQMNDQLDITLSIIREQCDVELYNNSASRLYLVNQSLRINDPWICEFIDGFKKCLSGEVFAEEILPKRYKTITENLILYGVVGEKLSILFEKYSRHNHPFVNYQVSSVLYNAKNYSQGLPILCNGIKSIVSYPSYYWHNAHGIEGAAWMLGDLLFLLGNESFRTLDLLKEKTKLLKLLFLYMSRYIAMTTSNIKSIDFYANRARVVKNNYLDFVGIFGIGVNPDIQFISDMYLAHQTGMNHNLQMFARPLIQFYLDSMKMYRHGSHIPNHSGGYQEIEDRTWMELVRDGEIKSIVLAETLLDEFENYELNIPNVIIDRLFDYIQSNKKDDFDGYMKKIKGRKL